MYEAARALLHYGFKNLKIRRIYAKTISENRSAIKLCNSLKMRKEAHFSQHRFFKGLWWDTAVYAILRNEWLDINGREEI
jgi:RimJ/RimL family protein N-acetyltransferase